MNWEITSNKPIYRQLMDQLVYRIISGSLAPGERLLPVRELAAEAGVNPNTMQRALAGLEKEGYLFANRTSGRYVTEDRELILQLREQLAAQRIDQFYEDMKRLGFSPEEAKAQLAKKNNFSESQ